MGLLALTGAVLIPAHAGNVLTLPDSGYGRTLLLKLAGVALALLAAARVRRALTRPRLALEALLLLAVLGLTAALGSMPPPVHTGHTLLP
ncbi:hypothetical protein [Deinococcus sp. YIM 77859]|uniref:hypothetical protein n=1 Tax=Deinococcus sp. YIM 77859 TaxID=1540221 RepID=UPI00350E3F09